MLCSYGFLPPIIQPTRVTDHHYLNIFSNNLIDETSGDILLTVCEHLSGCIHKEGENGLKNLNIYQKDFKIQHFKYNKLGTCQFKIGILNWGLCKMIKIRNKLFARKERQPNNTNTKRLYKSI